MATVEVTTHASGNNNDHVRRHNLSAVLGLAHRTGGLSRAQLTRATGLNRSTIADLVGELADRQLVVEVEPDSSGTVGRPSPVVRPNPKAVALAINPEVDAISIGVVDLGGQVLKRVRYPTPHSTSAKEAVAICAAVIDGMRSELDTSTQELWLHVQSPGEQRQCLSTNTLPCVFPTDSRLHPTTAGQPSEQSRVHYFAPRRRDPMPQTRAIMVEIAHQLNSPSAKVDILPAWP